MAKEQIFNRSVPYNTDAEMYVLGSILIDNTIIDSVIGKLSSKDFYDPKNQIIYQAMSNIHDSNIHGELNIVTVIEELKRLNYEDVDNIRPYLIEMIDSVPSTSSANVYINLVSDTSLERKLLANMQGLSDDILNHKYELGDMLDHVEDNLLNLIKQRRNSEFISIKKAAEDIYNKIVDYSKDKRVLTGLDTGYPGLNRVTLGLQNSEIIILAARPSVGKSAYALNLALNVASVNKECKGVAFFSLEMNTEQLMDRIFAYKAGVPLKKIRSGNLTPEELMLLSIAKDECGKLNLYFDENVSSNVSDIRLKCRQLKQMDKLSFVVIDYMQLITSNQSSGSRQEQVTNISRQLKTLALELQIPILVLSQLSRNIETRDDKEPTLADLRESGSIEQDADMVWFLSRRKDIEGEDTDANQLNEEVKALSPEPKNKDDSEMEEIVLSVKKNRQGQQASFDYNFYGAYCRFNEQPQFRPLIIKKKKNKGASNYSGMKNLK